VIVAGNLARPAEFVSETALAPAEEQRRVDCAISAMQARIQSMLAQRSSAAETGLLQAHLAILGDASLSHRIAKAINAGRSAGEAITEAGAFFGEALRQAENPYIRERAIDIQEICFELLEEIYGARRPALGQPTAPSVVVADNLPPQHLLRLDRKYIKALVLEAAGRTSHTVILARSLGIPAVIGVEGLAHLITPGEHVIVDANRGLVLRECTPVVQRFYQRQSRALEKRKETLIRHASGPAVTSDHHTVEVAANIGSVDELSIAFSHGADGIGLFRTEMLFLKRESAPSEQEQFDVYVQAAHAAGEKPVIIRTLDIGGDKHVPGMNLPAEDNPFLGYRGVRVYPDHPQLLQTQLRAIARASAFGRVQMMAPMISSIEEVRWIKGQLVQVQEQLMREHIECDPAMPVGAMIEVPSLAFILDQLCNELDFFSIGTNDLKQYFFAADRGNPKVTGLSNVRQPSFLRFLKHIVDEIHRAGKWVGMCGEMAGELQDLPLLLGLGLDELSITGSDVPLIKERISRFSVSQCRKLLAQALACHEAHEVEALLECHTPNGSARTLLDRELVLSYSESESKEEALREIVDALYVEGRTDDPDALEEAIWARETIYSTGLGYGFAVPHARTSAINASSMAVLKLRKPVEWGSLDGDPVTMVILLVTRESDPEIAQMQVFARLARKLMDAEFRSQLLRAKDPDAVLTFFSEELAVDLKNLP
jgi:fructose-specific PTS system IIA-like component